MIHTQFCRVTATLLVAGLTGTGALAAAPGTLDEATPQPVIVQPAGPIDFHLGSEIVVHGWVLCVSQTSAETIVKARREGVAEALAAYADLKAAKTCGQFPELHVILRESVYPADQALPIDARVFEASVSIGGGWPNGFLVYGGLPLHP